MADRKSWRKRLHLGPSRAEKEAARAAELLRIQAALEEAIAEYRTRVAARNNVQAVTALEREVDDIRRAAAVKKAEKLLLRHLTKLQAIEYKATGEIEVQGSHHRYRISASGAQILSGRFKGGNLCVAPIGYSNRYDRRSLPYADRVLTMKLWIEANEKGFLEVANTMWAPYTRVTLDDELVVINKYKNVPAIADNNLYQWLFPQPVVGNGTTTTITPILTNTPITTTTTTVNYVGTYTEE